jgi:hypothetical protein
MRVGELVRIKYTMRLYESVADGRVSTAFHVGEVGVVIDTLGVGEKYDADYVKIVHPNGVGWAWVNDVEVV